MLSFVVHNVLTESASTEGLYLLKCASAYLNVYMYAAPKVQTSETIAAGRREVAYFSKVLKLSFNLSSNIALIQRFIQEYEDARAPPTNGKSL